MSETRGNPYVRPRGPVLLFSEGRAVATGTRLLREKAGLGRAALAALIGWKTAWLTERERFAVRMTRAEAEQVAAALGTDYEGLLAAGRGVKRMMGRSLPCS